MNPVFRVNHVNDAGFSRIVAEEHLKLHVAGNENPNLKLNGIAFRYGHLLDEIQKNPFDLVFTLEENYWNEKTSLQLSVKDIQIRK